MLYRKNNGKLKKKNRSKTSKPWKRLFKIYIKTKLYVSQNFGNNLVVIRESKLALKLDKPAYTGMCISELSKAIMYKFHYGYIKTNYDNKSKLLLKQTLTV